jgi:hypothetical protein
VWYRGGLLGWEGLYKLRSVLVFSGKFRYGVLVEI